MRISTIQNVYFVPLLSLFMIFMVSACGTDDVSVSDDASLDSATLILNSPLPTEFGTSCSMGSVSDLNVFMVVASRSGSCPMQISSSSITGTCSGITDNQSHWVDLYFEDKISGFRLGMQGKMVSVPEGVSESVSVSFSGIAMDRPYDSDGDDIDNVAEFCAGTL